MDWKQLLAYITGSVAQELFLRGNEYLVTENRILRQQITGRVRLSDGEGIAALAVAIPTVGELYFGAYNSGRVEANVARVRAFLSPPGPQVLRMDEPAAEQFGRLKAMLRGEGRLISDIDLFVAGVALRHGLTVLTNNIGHFEQILDLPLENWLEPPQVSS
jgi:tRNA(fMet)-specific endonuclease VapC